MAGPGNLAVNAREFNTNHDLSGHPAAVPDREIVLIPAADAPLKPSRPSLQEPVLRQYLVARDMLARRVDRTGIGPRG